MHNAQSIIKGSAIIVLPILLIENMDNVKYIMKAKYAGSSAYGKANKYITIEFNDMPTVHAWISMNKEKE